jgi:rSAM/selenodomain-associated transferase 1
MDRALLVMAKEPQPGRTKTRLSPPLDGEEAAELYCHFLLDTLELMQRVTIARSIIAYHPAAAEDFFRRLAPPGFGFMLQAGAGLGERLHNAVVHSLQEGYRQVVITDSDSPTLPLAYLEEAFHQLDDPTVDVVLGPCEDGGYYLVGIKAPCAPLFCEVAMSTPSVLSDTLARADEQGLNVLCLPTWYDIDTYQDVRRLMEELDDSPAAIARHTRAYLSRAPWVQEEET